MYQGIDYPNLDYGTSLHFATIGSDGGHDGFTALPLLHHPEVLNDFSYRSIHAALVTGKLVVEAYYSKTPARSYYLGCSAGGRQGYQSALLYPEDFDGIVAGAPAVDWNRFAGAISVLATYVGAPEGQKSDRYITHSQWNLITREILKQCDTLDALADGIVAEPDECNFDPAALLCAGGQTENCLTGAQVNGLRLLYSPIYGSDGQEIWPRFDPGSELDRLYQVPMISQIHPMTEVSCLAFTYALEMLIAAFFHRSGTETRFTTIPTTTSINLALLTWSLRKSSILRGFPPGVVTSLRSEIEEGSC